MNGKTIQGILLFLSMILVIYPLIAVLFDTQNLISEAGTVPSELVKVRDNLILQIVGFVLLYLVLAFGLGFIRFEQQPGVSTGPGQNVPNVPEQTIKPKFHRVVKPLSNKAKNAIIVLFGSVFMLVFLGQLFFSLPLNQADTDIATFLLERALMGTVAALAVAIIAYVIVKYR